MITPLPEPVTAYFVHGTQSILQIQIKNRFGRATNAAFPNLKLVWKDPLAKVAPSPRLITVRVMPSPDHPCRAYSLGWTLKEAVEILARNRQSYAHFQRKKSEANAHLAERYEDDSFRADILGSTVEPYVSPFTNQER